MDVLWPITDLCKLLLFKATKKLSIQSKVYKAGTSINSDSQEKSAEICQFYSPTLGVAHALHSDQKRKF